MSHKSHNYLLFQEPQLLTISEPQLLTISRATATYKKPFNINNLARGRGPTNLLI